MFANTQSAGQDVAFPDECFTIPPQPPVGPQLVPYTNFAVPMQAKDFCKKVILAGGNAHTLSTSIPMSTGDEPGWAGGKKSGTFIGPARHTTSSAKVYWGGSPATRAAAKSSQNDGNADGVRVLLSQTKVKLST